MKDQVYGMDTRRLKEDHEAEVCIVILMDREGNVISDSDGPMGTGNLERVVTNFANGMAFDPYNGVFAHWSDDFEKTD